MNRGSRRRSRSEMAKLVAEIHEARLKWDALSPEEKMKAGSRNLHSTPGLNRPYREPSPGGPFAAWAGALPRPVSGIFAT
jgi:hypothetical protein